MTKNTDVFSWANPYGGDWGTAGNWLDTTVNHAAASAPGAGGTVTITGSTNPINGGAGAYTSITGTGAAASLGVADNVLLWGTVAVGGALTQAANADLELNGASLGAGSISLGYYGALAAGYGSTLDVTGALSLIDDVLDAVSGSVVQLGTLISNAGNFGSNSTILIDATSSIEVGTTGGAALGALTIDHGHAAAIVGTIEANVVVNGTLGVQGGGTLDLNQDTLLGAAQTVSGSGVLEISENSAVILGMADSAAIHFTGPSGLLTLGVLPTGTISGFGATDAIDVGNIATSVSYHQTSATLATLTLTDGDKVVGTLALAGNYTGSRFYYSPYTGDITLQTIGTAPVPSSLILGTAGTDVLTATANSQVITGLGGDDFLTVRGFTGIEFKDSSADLSGSTIYNLDPSDVFDLTDMNAAKASVSFVQPVSGTSPSYVTGLGTLTVTDGTHAAMVSINNGTTLAPGYFSTASDGSGGTDVRYVAVNTDAYTWHSTIGGDYNIAAKWLDSTTKAIATAAPSYGNAVSIAGGTANFASITGTGHAASLTTSGAVRLAGTLYVGHEVAGVTGALTQFGTLALDAHATLGLSGAATISGLVEVGAGSTLTASSATLGSGSVLEAFGGGYARFKTVTPVAASQTSLGGSYYPTTIGVDAASEIEIGSAGTPVKGALKIDGGTSAGLDGAIHGNVVVNGTLIPEFSLSIGAFGTVAPSVTGSGTLELNGYGSLMLSGTDSVGILFSAPSVGAAAGDLVLAGSLPTGTISGFAARDQITVDQAVTRLAYAQTGNTGTLTLFDGASKIGALTLAGSYTAAQFLLQEASLGGSATILYLPTPTTGTASPVSTTTHNYSWTGTFTGGDWDNAANWFDSTTDTTPLAAPGIGNAVIISTSSFGSAQIISGSGSAASLNVEGSGTTVFTGTLLVAGTLNAYGAVDLDGATMSAGTLYGGGGLLQVGGGSTLTVGAGYYGGNIVVIDHSSVRVDSLGYLQSPVAVDATSSFEFGTLGGATTGALTIDAGQSGNLFGGTIAANLVVNGTLQLGTGNSGYIATVEGFGGTTGTVSGSGTIEINPGSRLVLDAADSAAIAMTNPGNFSGTSATLELSGPLPTGTLSGFIGDDFIIIDHPVTGISYAATSGGQGVLTVSDGATTLGTIALAGDYTGDLFHLDVAPLTGFGTISLGAAPASTASGAASTGSDAYQWSGTPGGSWADKANWTDTTTASAPGTVPGGNTGVTIAGGPSTIVGGISDFTGIGGSGTAGRLAITGQVLFTGSVTVGAALTLAPAATLALSGASLTAGSATLSGEVEAETNSAVTVSGTATLSGGTLLALSGSTAQLGGLVGTGATLAVDGTSKIVIGSTTTGAAGGAITQQAGFTTALSGAIVGSVVANGTLAVAGGGALTIDMAGLAENDPFATAPGITGTGELLLSQGSTLALGASDSVAIKFGGPSATLQLAKLPTATISGFAAGDAIQVDSTVTNVSWTQTTSSAGTLTLLNGSSTVGTLALAGSYPSSSEAFHVDSAADGSVATISLQTVGITVTPPSFIQGTAAADKLSATAASQTITGLGGGDTLNAGGLAGIDFKDLTANLSGSHILNFATSDLLDFIDMNAASATASYSGGTLSVTDGTHAGSLALGFATTPASGGFSVASDGAAGTKLVWHS